MPIRDVNRLRIYDREINDYDLFNSIDDELIQIASPPLKVYSFNLQLTMGNNTSIMDELYNEVNIINEDKLREKYENANINLDVITNVEKFDPPILVYGYYQEPTFTQELSRLGIDMPEELAITFNYQHMLSKMGGKEIKIGDVVQTFRGKIYRVMDAYPADETVGWKYMHFHVIAKKPQGLDNLSLPAGSQDVPRDSNGI